MMSAPDSVAPASSAALSVLVAEPGTEDLEAVVSTLSASGFRVCTVQTFEAARERLATDPPAILIATVRLGLFNGLHLVLRGKAALPDLTALVTSPTDDPVLRTDAEQMGATFLVKPLPASELLAAVLRTHYESGTPGRPLRPPFERRQSERRVALRPFTPERRSSERRRTLSALVTPGR